MLIAMVLVTAVLVVTQVLDVVTTQQVIDAGKGVEGNPIMAKVFSFLPERLWWVVKLVIVIPIGLAWWDYMSAPMVAIIAFGVVTLSFVYMIINNRLVASGKSGLWLPF